MGLASNPSSQVAVDTIMDADRLVLKASGVCILADVAPKQKLRAAPGVPGRPRQM